MKTVKIKAEENTYIERRKVLYYVCEENDEDIKKRKNHVQKMGESNKKSVIRISSAGTMKYFKSITEAAEKTETASKSSISKCITGKQKTAGGYRFKLGD